MQKVNFLITALAALIPLVMGFIWYNKSVMGKAWIKSTGLTEEQLKGANMPLVFILTYVFSFFIAMSLNTLTIHQFGLFSTIQNMPGVMTDDPNAIDSIWLHDAMNKYGQNFRTFKHGVLHGVIASIMIVLPILGINALFERKSAKYVMIHLFYWIICMGLMGGVICQWT